MQAFELRECLHFYHQQKAQNNRVVMASLVGLKGSSYRQPGVRMLIAQDGAMSGALSGGCVEKEIIASAQSVFQSGVSKVISYDGRFRLGCEGFLHILIEPFELSINDCDSINLALEKRQEITIISHYKEGTTVIGNFRSALKIENNPKEIVFNSLSPNSEDLTIFEQTIRPNHQLIIMGAEHDAQKLNDNAVLLGWDVTIACSLKNPKNTIDFPGATLIPTEPEIFDYSIIDDLTSVVLMTHNYALDLKYLIKLRDKNLSYIGILGSLKRKASLENELLELIPDLESNFLEILHSPAGLDIGAVTPQEIALSILAEIMQIFSAKKSLENTMTTLKSTLS